LSGSSGKLLFGVALLLVGLIWLLDNMGAIYFDFGDFMGRAWPVAIILVGFWMLMGNRKAKVVIAGVNADHVNHGVGDIDYAPTQIGADGLVIKNSAGEIRVDLTQTMLQSHENKVEVKIGFGDIRIQLPKGVPVRIDGKTGVGDLYLLDRTADGFGASLEYEDINYSAAANKIWLVAKAGLGDVKVTRAAGESSA